MDFVYKVLEMIIIGIVFVPVVYFSNILGKFVFDKNTIKVKYHTDGIEIVQHGDWADLRSAEDIIMKKGDFKVISLGVSMEIPKGKEAHVVPRSSTFKTWGITQANSFGIIDNDYCGNQDIWRFPAYATRDTVIKKGDRICQFRISKKAIMNFKTVDNLSDKNRGGLGSTGKN